MGILAWIRKFFAPPVFEGDEEKTRNAALLNILLWVIFWAIVVVSIFQIVDSSTSEAAISTVVMIYGVFVPSLAGLIWMSRRGHVQRASRLLAALIWAVTTIAIIVFGGIRSTVTPAYFVAIFIAGLLMGWGEAVVFGFLATVSMFVVLVLERSGMQIGQYMIPIYPSTGAGLDDFFMLFGIVVTTTTIVGLSRRSIVSALQNARVHERDLAQVNRELQARSEELQARTRDLGRRSMQLQIAADISRDVTATRELDELLNRAVNLVQGRFDFYHVALYLVDEQDAYAVLRAATGEAGSQMLEQGRQDDLGEESPVSYVINSGYHRILFDVGEDAVSFANPLLPETRSEVVLPLRVGRRITGALDIQSRREEAFDGDDVAVLQSMVDQFAAAIENAQLLTEMQQTLRELEVASGLYTQDSWRMAVQQGKQGMGYRYRRLGIERAVEPPPEAVQAWTDGRSVVLVPQPDAAGDGQGLVSTLAVPVKLRDQVVGVLNLSFEDQAVEPDTVSLVEEVANRLALALENARLLDETRQRGQRDRLIADITAQVRASMDVERILQTAVRGLGAALGTERAFIQLGGTEGRLSSTDTGPLAPEALDNLPDDGGQEGSGVDEQVEEQAVEGTEDQIAGEANVQASEEMSE
jgi:GAF domain-containing protein